MFNKNRLVTLLLAAAVGGVSAERYGQSYRVGNPILLSNDNYTQALISNAQENPRATRSIPFKPFENSGPANLKDTEWTWRVNVSDFAAPNSEAIRGIPFVDPHVALTVFDFAWPGGGNLSSALGNSTDPFCVTSLLNIGLPANVSNGYTDEDAGSVDCTAALGGECVAELINTPNKGDPDTCSGPRTGWSDLEACKSTFGYAQSTQDLSFGTPTGDINGGNTTANFTIQSRTYPNPNLQSGEGFWSTMSGAYNASNATMYLSAVNQLQVLLIDVLLQGQHYPQLLCTRVNTTNLPIGNDSNGDGITDAGGNGTSTEDDKSAGMTGQLSSGNAWTVFICLVAAMAYVV